MNNFHPHENDEKSTGKIHLKNRINHLASKLIKLGSKLIKAAKNYI